MSLWLPGAKLYQIKTLLSLTITVKYLSNLSFSYSLYSYLMSLELRFLSYSVTSTTLFSVDNFVVIFLFNPCLFFFNLFGNSLRQAFCERNFGQFANSDGIALLRSSERNDFVIKGKSQRYVSSVGSDER